MNKERVSGWLVISALALAVGGGAFADPAVVLPSGLPVQVNPIFSEPGLPAFTFPAGGTTVEGIGSQGAGPAQSSAGATQGSSGSTGTQGSTTVAGLGSSIVNAGDYEQYVGSYYGPNQQCVSLTRYFDPSLPPSSQWREGELVQGATDIAPGTPIATFNFDGNYGPPASPGGLSGVSHTGIYLGQDATGVQIFDQYQNSGGAQIETIPWASWNGNTAEAGDRYYTISY